MKTLKTNEDIAIFRRMSVHQHTAYLKAARRDAEIMSLGTKALGTSRTLERSITMSDLAYVGSDAGIEERMYSAMQIENGLVADAAKAS